MITARQLVCLRAIHAGETKWSHWGEWWFRDKANKRGWSKGNKLVSILERQGYVMRSGALDEPNFYLTEKGLQAVAKSGVDIILSTSQIQELVRANHEDARSGL